MVFLFNATIDDLEEGCNDLGVEAGPEPPEDGGSTEDGDPDNDDDDESPLCSTPAKNKTAGFCFSGSFFSSPILGLHGKINKKHLVRRKKKSVRLNYTNELDQEVPREPNDRTEAKWQAIRAELLRFVDDGFCLSKINFENSYGYTVNGKKHRVKHALQAQNVFRHMVRRAEGIGMKVNSDKTAMICFLDAAGYKPDAFIEDSDGNRIRCQDSIKALGMRFSSRPDMSAHIDWIEKNMRERFWTLINLKKSGFKEEELTQVYKSVLRPVAEYGSVVFHSGLSDEQDERLDRLQNQALRCIFGPRLSGRKMRALAGLSTLRERREILCDKFARKCLSNPRFCHWFPVKNVRSSARNKNKKEFR